MESNQLLLMHTFDDNCIVGLKQQLYNQLIDWLMILNNVPVWGHAQLCDGLVTGSVHCDLDETNLRLQRKH